MAQVIDKKEKLLVEYLLSDRNIFIKAYSILKPSFFDAPLDSVVKFCLEYFKKHHGVPDVDIIEAETGVELKERESDESEESYILEEIEDFCSRQAMIDAIHASADLITESGSNISQIQNLVREALLLKIDNDLGTSLFDDVDARLAMFEEDRVPYEIGLGALDDLNGGSWYRGELYLFAAGTSVGKSVMLANVATLLAHQKLDALIVSVEMDEHPYSRRMDSIITGLPMKGVGVEDLAQSLKDSKDEYGNITTKRVGSRFGVDDLRAYLTEYHLRHGKYPDVFVLDYLDIFANGKNPGMGKFDWDEVKSHEIRDLLVEFDMMGFSACQLNRDSYGDVLSISVAHIAGGLSKANAADCMIAMIATDEDIDNNQLQLKGIKVRNASKTSDLVTIYRCPKTLRLSDKPFTIDTPKSTSSPVTKLTQKGKDDKVDTKSTKAKSKLNQALKMSKG